MNSNRSYIVKTPGYRRTPKGHQKMIQSVLIATFQHHLLLISVSKKMPMIDLSKKEKTKINLCSQLLLYTLRN